MKICIDKFNLEMGILWGDQANKCNTENPIKCMFPCYDYVWVRENFEHAICWNDHFCI